MLDDTSIPEDDDEARYEGLPPEWSTSAKEVYLQIEEANPNLGPAATATLWEACTLIAAADACEAEVHVLGRMIDGSRNSKVLNPLISEARHSRTAAMAALKGLALEVPGASSAGRDLATKRWNKPRISG